MGWLWCFERFDWMWGGSYIFFIPADPPAQCRAGVWVIRSLSHAQDYRFFVFVHSRPADALLSPEPGGDQGTPFTHNVTRDCVIFFVFFLFYFLLLDASPRRGTVGSVTFHLGICCFFLPPPSPPCRWGCGRFLGTTSPCLRACVSIQFTFLRLAPPPPH